MISLYWERTYINGVNLVDTPPDAWTSPYYFFAGLEPNYNTTHGRFQRAVSSIPGIEVTGSFTVATITFNSLSGPYPPCVVLLDFYDSETGLADNQGYELFCYIYDGDVTVSGTPPPPSVHDVAIFLPWIPVVQGDPFIIQAFVQNQGDFNETFSVAIYLEAELVLSEEITLANGTSTSLQVPRNSTGMDLGYYDMSAEASVVPGETDIEDNIRYGKVCIITPPYLHEIIVSDVLPLWTVIGEGYEMYINVTVVNLGWWTETFNVTVYALNGTAILVDAPVNITLTSGNFTIITFQWNTTNIVQGEYTIEAIADIVTNETSTENNRYLFGPILIAKVGDLGGGVPPQFFSCDSEIDGIDLALFIQCYKGLAPPEAMYLADLGGGLPPQFFDCDGKIDGLDLALFIECYKGRGPDT
jgi:hypothetical protein